MSLLNCWITSVDALIAVDSDGVRDDGARFASSKLLPIPHIPAVLALRGQAAFLSFLFLKCSSMGFESFDDLNDFLPVILQDVHETVPEQLIARNCQFGNEVLAVGWSHRRGEMLGRQFVMRDDMQAFSDRDISFHISPALPDLPTDHQALDRIAQAQVQWMRAAFPNAACGGKLITAHITKETVTVRHRLSFPPAVQVQEAAA